MGLRRGPQYEKDSDDLANVLSGGAVKAEPFMLVAFFALPMLVGVFS